MHNKPKYITYVQYIIQGVSTLQMYIIVTNVEFLVSENINIYLFLFYFIFNDAVTEMKIDTEASQDFSTCSFCFGVGGELILLCTNLFTIFVLQ